jgi:hypothetical protein
MKRYLACLVVPLSIITAGVPSLAQTENSAKQFAQGQVGTGTGLAPSQSIACDLAISKAKLDCATQGLKSGSVQCKCTKSTLPVGGWDCTGMVSCN